MPNKTTEESLEAIHALLEKHHYDRDRFDLVCAAVSGLSSVHGATAATVSKAAIEIATETLAKLGRP